ncbi:hypothetical protein GS894_02945 [Rhodococcus hoagii]|nr:hypothetical protein [Prescottella equi]NKS06720.1 hypothetical protein [Prescottella equi]NKS06738.1 hypothetical protein [Prescottella equi]NKT07374.1 hypothetical protein [Prescottella equi]NKT31653.1 hypothetical protein [Prescottella equi]
MKVRRLPADHVAPVKEFLVAQLAADPSGATADQNLPDGWGPSSAPAVVVASDPGSVDEWPVYTGEQIRIAVYAAGRTQARALAARCMGWLLALRVPGVGIRPGTGILVDRDPDTRGFIAGFTVRSRARTQSF